MSPAAPSRLPTILGRAGPLPATHAADIQPLRPGTLLVAPPDRHLLVDDDGTRLTRGPMENGHRPAVDPLFRSAARAHGNRVVGVVLSGALDDGSAGLVAIKSRHGVTFVQDPDEALYDAMPRNAIEAAAPDHVLPLAGIAALLGRLAREEPAEPVAPVSPELRLETDMTALDPDVVHADDRPGQPSPFSCPDCSGVLFELQEGRLHRFRCRVGHACPRTACWRARPTDWRGRCGRLCGRWRRRPRSRAGWPSGRCNAAPACRPSGSGCMPTTTSGGRSSSARCCWPGTPRP